MNPNRYRSQLRPHLERLESRQLLTVNVEFVADIRPGTKGSSIGAELFSFREELYFSADNGSQGKELWKTDGTEAGTQLVKDIHLGGDKDSSAPAWFVPLEGEFLFAAVDANGDELWKSDGTAQGTRRVKDINPGSDSSIPTDLFVFNDAIYFVASNELGNEELWRSDGTEAGTVMVKDIHQDGSSSPGLSSGFFEHDGYVYFDAEDDDHGVELWRTDGTENGTSLVHDAEPGDESSWPANFVVFRDELYFTAEVFDPTVPNLFSTLYRVDSATGTAARAIDTPVDLFEGITVVGDHMYFTGFSEESGVEIYRSDGTDAGTQLLRNIMPGNQDANPRSFFKHDGRLFFAAADSRNPQEQLIYQLWVHDELGTRKVTSEQINPQNSFVAFQGDVYFSAYDQAAGWELFKTNEQFVGATLVADINEGANDSLAIPKRAFNGHLLLLATENSNGWEIWTYDGERVEMIETHFGGGGFTSEPTRFQFHEFGQDLVYVGSNPFEGGELHLLRSVITELKRLDGDADENGRVDFADFLLLSQNFGNSDADWQDGDFDHNGHVDFADFLLLAENFGQQQLRAAPPQDLGDLTLGIDQVFRSLRWNEFKEPRAIGAAFFIC